ncbi:hypothetical protein CDIK_0775 [Cucumispora dikerogammari]|nr:hypothetical protein CDIK_0775 [Cucumispora dikerogammari]
MLFLSSTNSITCFKQQEMSSKPDITFTIPALNSLFNNPEQPGVCFETHGEEEKGKLVLEFVYSRHVNSQDEIGEPKISLQIIKKSCFSRNPNSKTQYGNYSKNIIHPEEIKEDFQMGIYHIKTEDSKKEGEIVVYYKGYIKSLETTQLNSKEAVKKELQKFRERLLIKGDEINNTEFKFDLTFNSNNKVFGIMQRTMDSTGVFYFMGEEEIELKIAEEDTV